jgi:YegS/Rv2252/BmrU family lipid kinase
MSVAIIINPKSGGGSAERGRRRADLAARILTEIGEHADVFVTTGRGHGRELAAAAVRRGARLVIAWGGDGTINEVASSLVSTPAALGIVRSGSGNSLARELGISTRPAQALRAALAATPRAIDAGEIDGQFFVSIAGIGFDAHVADCFDRDTSGRRGFSTYVRLAMQELWAYRCNAYTIDGQAMERAMLITIANSAQFGNGARIAPGARVDDGLLDLVTFEESSRLATLVALPRLFVGGLERATGVKRRRIVRATIESHRPIRFHADGEPREGGTRIEVRVLPGVLRVAVR